MSNDPLSEATRALRETEEVSELEARSTRARVLTGLHQTRVRRRTRLVFLLPVAATFMAVSAWGAANGKAQAAFETLEHWLSPPSNVLAPRQRRPHPSAPAQTSVPVPVPVSAQTSVPVPVPVPVPAQISVPVPAQASVPAQTSAPVPAPPLLPPLPARSPHTEPVDRALTLYRAAHTAHFVDHDPARALVGWDAYLAAAPLGPFAPEARYNRALSLVRLGRLAEARAALEPFANGTLGGYRQDEANALLERLGH
jgi:hypothetical protein